MNIEKYDEIRASLPAGVRLIAVSKFKPAEDIALLYQHGQRAFGENHAQEMKAKHEELPKDIEWHFIGHLQTNKIKYIAPYVALIHSIDSFSLLQEVKSPRIYAVSHLSTVLHHKSNSHSSCATISTVSEYGLLGECFKMLAWPKCKSAVKYIWFICIRFIVLFVSSQEFSL